jgi:hypothetical protein
MGTIDRLCCDDGMNNASAPYLLDTLGGLPAAERRQAVASVLLRVWEMPSLLLHEIPPTQAITAVAVVAASLPAAAGRPWLDARLIAAVLPEVSIELAMRALSALDVVVGRDPESVHLDLHVSDGAAAQALLDDLRQVLLDSIRPY